MLDFGRKEEAIISSKMLHTGRRDGKRKDPSNRGCKKSRQNEKAKREVLELKILDRRKSLNCELQAFNTYATPNNCISK